MSRAPFPDGVPLTQFFTDHFPRFSPATRKSWVREAARFCRRCHEAGLRIGPNLMADLSHPWQFSLVSSPAEPSGAPLSQPQRWSDLAELLGEHFTQTRRGDRFLFLREYLQDRRRLRTMRSSLSHLEERALDKAARRWRMHETECVQTGVGFIVERSESFRVYRRSSDEAKAAVAALLPDPDRLLLSGESRSDRGSGCVSAKISLAGRPYFLKRYDCRGAWYRLKNAFRRSRAMRVWMATWGLRARDIGVPEPLVLLEERHFFLLGRSYILSSFHEEGERMMVLWPHLNAAEQSRLVAQCAILLGRIHAMNMVHGDTNWDNILVCGSAAAPRLVLVDLDGCKPVRRMTRGHALRDIHHFVRDLLRERNRGDHLLRFFLDCWVRWVRPRLRSGPVPARPFQQLYRGLK
jgi:tRNA A-37 threonylcarbamoyl transferase component Bud32